MSRDDRQLKDIRQNIDNLDENIQRMINERATLAQQIAQIKAKDNPDASFYRPKREAEVLQVIKQRNQGPLGDNEIARIFREIMSACLALEKPIKIAFLGPESTFTHAAVFKHFGHSVKTQPLMSITDVFREVESGNCDYGVVPIENSTEGVVTHTLDLFISSPLAINGEVILRIHHNLMSKSKALTKIHKIYSHQQSLAQCRRWIDQNMHHAELVAVSSNAEAGYLASKETGTAAIAGAETARKYQLNLLSRNIEDEPGNTTRFLIIGNYKIDKSGEDKTSILFSAKNESGSLYKLLKPFAQHGISMTRIESRPSGRAVWDYVFFVDIIGHMDDEHVAHAIEELHKEASMCKVLGSYPIAVL